MEKITEWLSMGCGTVFTVSIALVTFSFTAVVLRFISRALIRRRVSADDWFILLAWLLSLGLSIALCIGAKHGIGSYKDFPIIVIDLGARRRTRFAVAFLYNPTLMATKISIFLFYLSLFKNFKYLRFYAWITIVVAVIGGLIATMLILFQCSPVSAAFTTLYPPPLEASCRNTIKILYACAPLNIITDLAILMLPMPILTSLKLPRKEKIVVVLLFAGGGFVAVVGVVRIYFLDKALASGEFDRDGWLSFMWSAIEVNVGIVCASIPMLKPLAVKVVPGFLGSSTRETSYESEFTSGSHDRNLNANSVGQVESNQSCNDTIDLFNTQAVPISAVGAPMRHVWKALVLVTSLFFFGGFAYGLLGVLRSKFQVIYNLSTPQALVLHGAYFAPYLFTPRLFSGIILKKYSFKATFITGLLLYAAGALAFWPAGILGSFPGFVVAGVFSGVGMATLETAANPYMALVGPLGMGETRLNIAQGFQAVGTICVSLLEYRPVPHREENSPDKRIPDMDWVFLAIVFLMFFMAVILYYFRLPEPKDSDFHTLEIYEPIQFWRNKCAIGPVLAIMTVFLYTGGQEIFTVFWEDYFISVGMQSDKYALGRELLGTGLFAGGRFVSGIVLLWLCPRIVLTGAVVGSIITSGLAITQTGKTAATMMVLSRFFQSTIFPTVFSMGLRGVGHRTRAVAVYLVTGICGGSALLNIYYPVAEYRGTQFAMLVPTIYFCLCLVFPLYCYLSPYQRNRFGFPTRGDTVGRMKCVQSVITKIYRYIRKWLSNRCLGPGPCNEGSGGGREV